MKLIIPNLFKKLIQTCVIRVKIIFSNNKNYLPTPHRYLVLHSRKCRQLIDWAQVDSPRVFYFLETTQRQQCEHNIRQHVYQCDTFDYKERSHDYCLFLLTYSTFVSICLIRAKIFGCSKVVIFFCLQLMSLGK